SSRMSYFKKLTPHLSYSCNLFFQFLQIAKKSRGCHKFRIDFLSSLLFSFAELHSTNIFKFLCY
ncbi:MAG: hypothetical protein EBT08_14185, partial [Betaproteobacteria bacterium]|nr:hypothetical protein [Betaproteobacteria bacterium]